MIQFKFKNETYDLDTDKIIARSDPKYFDKNQKFIESLGTNCDDKISYIDGSQDVGFEHKGYYDLVGINSNFIPAPILKEAMSEEDYEKFISHIDQNRIICKYFDENKNNEEDGFYDNL
jgi:hypothetical protein